jgi:hypothetical protein
MGGRNVGQTWRMGVLKERTVTTRFRVAVLHHSSSTLPHTIQPHLAQNVGSIPNPSISSQASLEGMFMDERHQGRAHQLSKSLQFVF